MNSLWRWCQVTGMRSERNILLFATIYAVNNGISFTMSFCVLLVQLNPSEGTILSGGSKNKTFVEGKVWGQIMLIARKDCIRKLTALCSIFYYICGSSHYITNILLVRDYSLMSVLFPHVIFKPSVRQTKLCWIIQILPKFLHPP